MTSYHTLTMECDRCGKKEDITHPHMKYEWAIIQHHTYNSSYNITPRNGDEYVNKHKDICPTCSTQLYNWWINTK